MFPSFNPLVLLCSLVLSLFAWSPTSGDAATTEAALQGPPQVVTVKLDDPAGAFSGGYTLTGVLGPNLTITSSSNGKVDRFNLDPTGGDGWYWDPRIDGYRLDLFPNGMNTLKFVKTAEGKYNYTYKVSGGGTYTGTATAN